ncbi:LysR family transcriptional regulator [Amycolatopsis nivea]|uniref:LysR family transcriptional regulator n=1 Tax=Amycolatopsis nivea TaxID=1644109 RepID=UPI00106FDDBC|nr:LysR family transcriptional regulator [Amycolatopsis nivea]
MNIETLRYAQAVSQTRSFSAAARAYGVTQPALSNGVARLEEELGVRLFDRSPRGVKPTAHGARLLPMIDHALDTLDAVATEARRLAAPPAGTIRVGVSPLIGADLVARAFDAARALAQPSALVLREADLAVLREALAAGELDLLLVPAVQVMPGCHRRVIAREPVVVIDPVPAEADGPVELRAAADADYILVPDSCGLTTFTTDLFTAADLPIRAYPGEAASYRVLEDWASMGVGAAILPRSKITREHANCRPLVRNGRPVEIAYEAVWAHNNPLGATLEELAEGIANFATPGH